MLLLNLLVALAWVVLTGEFTIGNFAVGFLITYLILRLTRQSHLVSGYVRRISLLVRFLGFFLKELVLSSLRVMVQVLLPRQNLRPAVVAVPLDLQSDAGITLLANLITLTPGTLTLDVSTDRKMIYIHVIDLDDLEAFRTGIKQGFERRIIEVME